ncbi:MAG: outer membrane lipoprotein-sorting protein [Candidatus Zixiibacteriota bacterium]
MKRNILVVMLSLILVLSVSTAWSENKLTADQILKKVDEVENAPKDQMREIKMVLTDKGGKESLREMNMWQKGFDKRTAKFTAPADQKGIGFLSLPNDVMYLYLPAFKKTRRIAAHVKNSKFAGTDFTYEDMEGKKYSEKWNPEFLKEEDNDYVLQLKPKPETNTDYSKLVMWVNSANFYIVKIEHYDQAGKLRKVLNFEDVKQINGYWIATVMVMNDLKEEHKTRMTLSNVKYDTGLTDEIFTERYLSR